MILHSQPMIGLLMLSRNILFQQTMQYSRGCLDVFSRVFSFFVSRLQLNAYFCKNYSCRKPDTGKSKGGIHIHKRRNCTLWFWRLGTSQLQIDLSKTKQRGRPVGCIYIVLWTFATTICCGKGFGYVGYIHHRGAFGVARFDKSGNSRAFRTWSERQVGSTFFLYMYASS